MSTKKRGSKRSNKCLGAASSTSPSPLSPSSSGEPIEKKLRPAVTWKFVDDERFDSEWIQANRIKLSIPSTVTHANQVPISFRSSTDLLESLVLPLDHGQLTSGVTKLGWIQLLAEATSCLLRDIVGIVTEFYPLEFIVLMTMARSDPSEMRHQFHIMEVVSHAHRYPNESQALVKWMSNDNFISDDIVKSVGEWTNRAWHGHSEMSNWPFHRESSTTRVGRIRDRDFINRFENHCNFYERLPDIMFFMDYVRSQSLTLTVPLLKFLQNTNVLYFHLPTPSTEIAYRISLPPVAHLRMVLSRGVLRTLICQKQHNTLRWMIQQGNYPVVEWINLGASTRYGTFEPRLRNRAEFFSHLVFSGLDETFDIDYAETWRLLDKFGVVSELIYDKTFYLAVVLSKAIAELEHGELHGQYYTMVYGELRYPATKTPSELFTEYCSGHDPKSIHEAGLPVSPNGDDSDADL
jgi:hypothetical protein